MTVTRRCVAALVLVLAFAIQGAHAASTKITFVLVNDIYLMDEQVGADGKARGGFPRLAAVVKAERAKGGHVILAHGGDTLSPSLMSGIDRGASIMTLTNMIPPDIFVPGNHEFDFGKAVFLQRMQEAKFPLYAANLRGPDNRPIAGFKDRSIVEFDGVRIGLTGATFDDTRRASSAEDLKFLPTIDTVKTQSAALRQEGADFVVAVVHADRPQDFAIMESRAADLVLSGHDHDLFVNYDGRTAAVESSYDAHYVTAVDVTIDVAERDGRRVTTWWPQFRIIDTATVTPDPEVAAVVKGYEQELAREMDVAIGTTAIELDSRNAAVRTGEAAIGDLIADAMREAAKADAAVTNGGGIRGNKVYAPGGPITRRDVLAELPFSNHLVTIEINGAGLKQALEHGLDVPNAGAGRFPQVSGIRLEIDRSRPAGSRIVAMRIAGAPLSPTRIYKVATNDFLARGGDGYTGFRDAKRIIPDADSPLIANAVMAHIRKLGTVRAEPSKRIVFK